jgi:hypothetical protein
MQSMFVEQTREHIRKKPRNYFMVGGGDGSDGKKTAMSCQSGQCRQ